MTNPNLTLIAVLLDRSGSMQAIKSDTEGGFDAFIAEQRIQPGAAVVTLAQFDNDYERVYRSIPIEQVPPLELRPRGSTALLDGIGRFTTEIGEELAALPEHERPGTVIVVVITDGQENASTEWSLDAVKSAITRQEHEYAWDYVFLGANMDAVSVGAGMGFARDKSITYDAAGEYVGAAYSVTAGYVSRKRSAPMGASVAGFSDLDRSVTRE
ncbi:VWA domain-containing protein [Rhodococcus sp. NPDC004095]